MMSQQQIDQVITNTQNSSNIPQPNTNNNNNDPNNNTIINDKKDNKNVTKPFSSRSYYIQKYQMNNANFETYYKKQGIITDNNEWELFLKTLKTELPTSFRFNPSSKLHEIYKQKLLNDDFKLIEAEEAKIEHSGIVFKRPVPLSWYPHSMGWQCNFPKRYLNKHRDYLSLFRNFLVESNETGIISRQETVSMIPGLILSLFIQSSDNILDMCAAPGNKTAQILELLTYNLNGISKEIINDKIGMIIANDADEKRAHVMVHQLKRIGLNNFVVTNKLAQCIPRLKIINPNNSDNINPEYLLFDSILCDVPCSSDGTLRKSPDLWKKWSTAYGNGLHNVQLSILIHAMHLCKPGGVIVYSTCTFNPIENEAVISSALLKVNHFYQKQKRNYKNVSVNNDNNDNDNEYGDIEVNVELIDISDKFPTLKRNNGLNKWIVWDKNMQNDCFYDKYDDVDDNRKQYIKETMFMPNTRKECVPIKDKVMDYLHLDRCMRFLPHYHNTGGFFVAVLRKIDNGKQVKKPKQIVNDNGNDNNGMDVDNTDNNDDNVIVNVNKLVDKGMLDDDKLLAIEKREFERRQVWDDNIPYYKLNKLKNYEIELNKLIKYYGLKVKDTLVDDNDNDIDDKNGDDNDMDDDDVPYFDPNEILIRGTVNPRSLWFVPISIANVVSNPDNHQLRIVQCGCRAFVRHDTKVTQHACKWRLTQDGSFFFSKYLRKQKIYLPLELFLMLSFVGKLILDDLIEIDDGKYADLVENNIKLQLGGPIISTINVNDDNKLLNPIWKSLSGWKSFKRIDLMIKKQQILLLQNHLKNIYKNQCIKLKEKYPDITIEFDNDKNRANFNQLKSKKKTKKTWKQRKNEKKKRKRKKQSDWKHRKHNNSDNTQNSNNDKK